MEEMQEEYDQYCVVCGGSPRSDRYQCPAGLNQVSTPAATRWLSDMVGVTPEHAEQPIALGTYDSFGWFRATQLEGGLLPARFATLSGWEEPKRGKCGPADPAPAPDLHWLADQSRYAPKNSGSWVRYGVAFHRACGEVLQQRLGYAVNFDHVWPLLRQQQLDWNHLAQQDYGGLASYHGYSHMFEFGRVPAEDEYMLLDPRLCFGNADRIVSVWEPLVTQFLGRAPTAEQPAGVVGNSITMISSRGGGGAVATAVSSSDMDSSAGQAPGATSAMQVLALPDTSAATLLQLIIAHAASKQQQLHLTAQLLPLSSTMPQILSGSLQLKMVANTAPKLNRFIAWLRKYSGIVGSLDLDAAVDCCHKDAHDCSRAVARALKFAAGSNKGLQLASFTSHVFEDSDAQHLLWSLPLAHTTSLHIGGTWQLSASGAHELAAATALHTLSLPGAGLAARLTAPTPNSSLAAVLATSLQRLSLTDAGCCSAADLRALSQQLTALTELQLTYHPPAPDADENRYTALEAAPANVTCHEVFYSSIVPEVYECWAELPALRSLQLGPRKVPYEEAFKLLRLNSHESGVYEPIAADRLLLDDQLLSSLAAATSLTSLCLGPSTCYLWGDDDECHTGMQLFTLPLQTLTGLRTLEFTAMLGWDQACEILDGRYSSAWVEAITALPELRELVVLDTVYEGHTQKLVAPGAASQLTRVELVRSDFYNEALSMNHLLQEMRRANPRMLVVWDN